MAKAKKESLSLEELLEQALVKEEDRPYEVPGNWVWTRLDSILTKLTDGSHFSPRTVEEGFPYITVRDLNEGNIDFDNCKKISYDDFEVLKNNNCQPLKADVLFSKDGTVGKTALVDFDRDFVVLSSLAILRPNKKALISKYLERCLNSPQILEQALNAKTGTALRRIVLKSLSVLPIPLPPLAEQQRIVKAIESLFEKLDTAKELVQNALDSFESRKAAILHKAFTGELTAKWREENKAGSVELAGIEEEPFGIPKEWIWTSLEELISVLGDGLHGTPKYSDTGEYYFINGNNLKDGKIEIKSDTKKVDVSEFEKYKKKLALNTVFVSINGTLGNTAFYNNEPIILGKSACYFNLLNNYNKFYIRYYLQTLFFKNYANSEATGSTIKNLSLKSMRNLPVPMTSLAEQQQIIRLLDTLLENEQRAKELCDVIEKIDHMKKAILARAFSGELSTNDPEEESAVELLKEVLREKL